MEESGKCTLSKLSACALGLAFGFTWALGMLIIGGFAWVFEWGAAFITMMSSIYVGFALTPVGLVIGVLWGFVDGFICGFIVAWVYNFCLKRCTCKRCKPDVGETQV